MSAAASLCGALEFVSCPIQSRFIDSADDARAYYHFRLVAPGPHLIEVQKRQLQIQFNALETHLFSTEKKITDAEMVARVGEEPRYFARERARLMDLILPALSNPSGAIPARIRDGVSVYGPPFRDARRLCVVLAPERSFKRWFVRSAYPVSAQDYRNAVAAAGRQRRVLWPP